jgi:hypothetical protein
VRSGVAAVHAAKASITALSKPVYAERGVREFVRDINSTRHAVVQQLSVCRAEPLVNAFVQSHFVACENGLV